MPQPPVIDHATRRVSVRLAVTDHGRLRARARRLRVRAACACRLALSPARAERHALVLEHATP